MKFRSPQAASRHLVLPTHNCQSTMKISMACFSAKQSAKEPCLLAAVRIT